MGGPFRNLPSGAFARELAQLHPVSLFRQSVRGDDQRLPWKTYGKYGGAPAFELFSDVEPEQGNETPVVFVHGNTRDASDWVPMMKYFVANGYGGASLWAITFRQRSPTHEEMATQLDAFVEAVRAYTGSETVSVVGHSLGVTGLRYWLAECDRYGWVEAFVGIAGANHGTHLATTPDRLGFRLGAARPVQFLNPERLDDSSHPLSKLNENETPGDIRYYTVRGSRDRYFERNPESPVLAGAEENLEVDATHEGVRTHSKTVGAVYDWVTREA